MLRHQKTWYACLARCKLHLLRHQYSSVWELVGSQGSRGARSSLLVQGGGILRARLSLRLVAMRAFPTNISRRHDRMWTAARGPASCSGCGRWLSPNCEQDNIKGGVTKGTRDEGGGGGGEDQKAFCEEEVAAVNLPCSDTPVPSES